MEVKQIKNTSLLLISLVLIWWISNTVTSLASKRFMLDEQPNDKADTNTKSLRNMKWIDLTFIQFALSAIFTFTWIKLYGIKTPSFSIYNSDVPKMALFGHMFGHMATNASYAAISSSTTQMIKACEPIFTFVLLLFLNQRKYENLNCSLLLSLLMMSSGTCLFVAVDSKFNIQGVVAALVSNCAFATRNILLKGKGSSFKKSLIQYFHLSVHCFFFLLPFGILRLPKMRKMQFTTVQDSLISAGSFFTYNVASINVLKAISPIQHALLNLFKRVFVIVINILYFSTPMHPLSVVGFLALFIGLLMYIRISHGISLPQKYVSRSKQAILFCSLFSLPVMSFQFFMTGSTSNTNIVLDNHIKSLWIYERPLPIDVLQNVKAWNMTLSKGSAHVFCGNFGCVKDLSDGNRTTTSFLVISTLINNTVFDTWFSKHPLNKIFEGKNFEDHLQQVVALSLIFRKGGTYFDPRVRLPKELLQTINGKGPCIAMSSTTNLPNIMGLFNFPKEHPLILKIGEVMVDQYKKDADDIKKWPIRFNFREISSIACRPYPDICANIIELEGKQFIVETPNIQNSFGTLSYDARVRVAADANLGDEIQGFPGLQFLPFMDEFVERDQLYSTNKAKNITTFFNAWWGSPSQQWPPPMHIDPIMLSMHLGNAIKPMISNNLPYLKGKSPIGCRDPATLEFLRSQGVEAFYSSCMTLMMKNPSKGAERTDNIYLVDVNDAVRKLLPSEIQQKGISLEHNMKGESRLNKLARFKSAYSLIEKYARAKLVVTQRIHCALPCVAMGTPVIFINSASMPGGGGTKRKGSPRTEGFQELFHMLDLYNMSSNDAKTWLQNFDWNKPRPLSSSSSLLKRLRATSWNIIRQKRKLHESALKFGIIPYHNSLLEEDRKEQDLFHLIFTTRGAQVVEVFSDQSKVSARFNWRHWRCIESIFYHHPLAKVLVHSNTLPLAMFEVLEESGYDIEVRRYNLLDIVKSTPAEKFMKEKYNKVKNRTYWYSHETDLLRTAILYKMGGVYMDTDVILVRSLRKLPINVVGYERDGKMMNGAFMYFQKNHRFLFDILRRFNQEYNPNQWGVVGPELITKILHLNSSAHYNVTVLNHHAFYMFHYRKINDECFQQTNGTTFREKNKILKEKAFAVHVFSKFSGKIGLTKKLKEGTICKKLFNAYCILCDKRY